MALSERDVEIEAELQALKFILANALALFYGENRKTALDIQRFHRGILDAAERHTVPGIDPALSDHYSDVFREKVAENLKSIEVLSLGDG
jgi:hypothetical protein